MRWIVDGMNVIGSRPDGWWKDRRRAMAELVAKLDRWAEELASSDDVTVVFEQEPTPSIDCQRIAISFAPHAAPNSADDEIVRLVEASESPGDITVVTSDGLLSARVQVAGASLHSAASFRRLIDSA